MHILITGAAGMIGRKLTERLVKDGNLNGKPIDRLTLIDVVPPTAPADFSGEVSLSASDLCGPGVERTCLIWSSSSVRTPTSKRAWSAGCSKRTASRR